MTATDTAKTDATAPCVLAALRIVAAVALSTTLGAVTAEEPGAHVHGVAELRIVVDGPQLEVALETPLDNVLGFEHAPRTEEQRAAVRAMAGKLRQPQLFQPTPAARCRLSSAKFESAVLPAALLGEMAQTSPAAAGARPGVEASKSAEAQNSHEHADLDAAFTWRCEVPAELRSLDVGLMQTFPRMHQIDVQIVGPRGQSALRLTAGARRVAW